MKRQGAFEGQLVLLKGGLHSHTTRSDGQDSPEDVVRAHAENGFDFLSITDHRIYNHKNYAPDTDILIIPGMEFDATAYTGAGFRCFHTVCLGPDDETNGFGQDEEFESGMIKNQHHYQKYLDWIYENNNIAFYCHPQWSSTYARHFDQLQGMMGIEVWNTACVLGNDMDFDAPCWDELLGIGVRLWGIATDDGHAMYQHCKGWVMVNAEKNIKSILAALVDGKFYSTTGPVIKDFYVKDGVAHIKTDGCQKILFHADRHPNRKFEAKDGENLTDAQLDLRNSYSYIRASVVDDQGRRAWTNPIFID